MRKRILAALLCACLLVPALTAPAFAAFPDVPADEWYTEYVDFCTEKGIVNGFEDGTFRPTGYLRRSEFIKMLATSASLTYKSELPGKHWAEEYWAMLSENGVLEGLDIPCTFDALQAKTTRYEMAVMIRNFLAKVRGETEAVTTGRGAQDPGLGVYSGDVPRRGGAGVRQGHHQRHEKHRRSGGWLLLRRAEAHPRAGRAPSWCACSIRPAAPRSIYPTTTPTVLPTRRTACSRL